MYKNEPMTPYDWNSGIEDHLRRHSRLYLMGCLLCFIITGAGLFDTKIFPMGDDADYIIDGWLFIHDHVYPGRSSLYGMLLGVLEVMFGTNVVVLKLFSFAFAITAFILFFYTFRNRIPYRILIPVLFFTAIHSGLQYYSSSNLSEAFFMMIQLVWLQTAFLLIDRPSSFIHWCFAGFVGLVISLSKNIAIVAPFRLPLFFACSGSWRKALLALGSFAMFKIPYEILLRLVYGKNTGVSQLGQVLAKDLYHPEDGNETLYGFLLRFLDNARIYISGDILAFMGFRRLPVGDKPVFYWILFAIICSYGLWRAFRNNRYMLFTGIYLCIMISFTFVTLQPAVAQSRIIIIYTPLLFCWLLFSIQGMFNAERWQKAGAVALAAICLVAFIVNIKRSVVSIGKNLPVLAKNIQTDRFYGYTQDWVNYLNMGQYITEHIPDSVGVAVRKPNSLSVYFNRRPFLGIYKVSHLSTADDLLLFLKYNKVRYLVVANIRRNPRNPAMGAILSPLHKYVNIIMRKYPDAVRVVHREGKEEPCWLMELRY